MACSLWVWIIDSDLGRAALVDGLTVAIALACLLALLRFRTGSAWLVLAGALAGWVYRG